MLRRILHGPGWTDAVLLVQWEVARRRAAVGGATMMTAQWWPWFEFGLGPKGFRRRRSGREPSVDGGLMTIGRRADPLVDAADRRRYQAMVHQVFTGRGRGIAQILSRQIATTGHVRNWLRDNDVRADRRCRGTCPPHSGRRCSRLPAGSAIWRLPTASG